MTQIDTDPAVKERPASPNTAVPTPFERDIFAGRLRAGMNFRERAWAMCARIPAGRVVTYGAIAAALGSPKGARAVGMAMNKNPYAPRVPCHRVVGSDGKLTGYARGLAAKRAMLEEEGVELERDADRVAASALREGFDLGSALGLD